MNKDGTVTILGELNSKNYLYSFKEEGWEVEEFLTEDHLLWSNGLEDGRLFNWSGRLWALFSACHQGTPNRWQIISRNTMVLMDVETRQWVPLHTDTKREKNWMPIPSERLYFLYSTSPWVVLNQNAEVELAGVGPTKKWSGSSCFIPFEKGWLGVVHRRREVGVYEHAFLLMNEDLTFDRISKPFCFHADQIEFCAGLERKGESFFLSYGVMDKEAWICEVSKEAILERF